MKCFCHFIKKATNINGKLSEAYTFEVEEYVLPKFEVDIGFNKNFLVLNESGDIPFKLDATYTFGKAVPGDAKIVVKKMPCDRSGYGYYHEPVLTPSVDCLSELETNYSYFLENSKKYIFSSKFF